jgi:hypothetical protein
LFGRLPVHDRAKIDLVARTISERVDLPRLLDDIAS